ncbi:META domain-containing protein [Novosphingobium sp. MMS21-SN21R]|uniref:META domain-containing protein n=1 Tax=Novosphingobium sp. MMS21-SN21R TaxID=2969298 RepID=UPI002887B270|nr:META domain-containing protein [Novosphingobium sp. MMS21-SN21R]MDT0509154.1 META domain-containing protein [Novosphingobium sp. MMS21-SN21R]
MHKALALILVPLALLGGCATAPTGGGALAGTTWSIMRIDGAPPVAPDKAMMRFDQERLSASVGCNGIGGDYRVEGGRLIAGPLMATRMFCEGPVWKQEEAVNALLSAAPEIQRSGATMRLMSGGHALDLQLASD